MITLEDLANPNMLDAFVVPEQEWAIMTPEEKAAIMFPDMSTLPLNDKEKKHVYEMFEFKDPDAWRAELNEG